MNEPAKPTPPARPSRAALRVAHESYSFACMRCGHGWEQSFTIEHCLDAEGRKYIRHVVDGRLVPSPLSRPTCARCGNHLVRIMRAGRVASAREAARRPERPVPAAPAGTGPATVPRPRAARAAAGADEHHHWHLSDLLHVLHLHRRPG
ncbi:hypothetical protein ACFY4K_27445 [Streptomyces leeuwenhoekii]|uniref:hypothetical protein n=1 Tax=Streptomyces leeuwenhoekii TaxID=1437453 RepID=UPI0036786A21